MSTVVINMIKRNIKLYFKDRTTFLTSLISPMILLVLFITFLGNVYKESILAFIPDQFNVSSNLINTFTISWLLSSLLGVSSVTVAFCSNIIMAQDKLSGTVHDLLVAPIKKSTLAITYFISNIITTTIVCYAVTIVGLIYISTIGWYFSICDIIVLFLDVFLAVLFGTSFAAIVENFVSTQGGIGAISTLISALYGFICGAYMPIAEFSEAIRKLISFLPGTYTIALLRNDFLRGVLDKFSTKMPDKLIQGIKDGFDVNVYFFDAKVQVWQMYTVVSIAIVLMILAYIIINKIQSTSKSK